jgi:hypothetical protein
MGEPMVNPFASGGCVRGMGHSLPQKTRRKRIKKNISVGLLSSPHTHEARDVPRCGALSLQQSRNITGGFREINALAKLNGK